jgi:hypothetical protein
MACSGPGMDRVAFAWSESGASVGTLAAMAADEVSLACPATMPYCAQCNAAEIPCRACTGKFGVSLYWPLTKASSLNAALADDRV